MDTTREALTTGRRRRRHHSVFFKAEAVGACQQPGVSIASVALARGLNANLLRRWVLEAERGDAPIAIRSSRSNTLPDGADGFVPVSLASSPTECMILIELHRREASELALAGVAGTGVRADAAGTHEVIRIDAAWIAVEPLDMRAGVDTALARVVNVFGEARSHHAYLFLNRRANRLKVFVHDGFGLWLCARRLQQGHFMRPSVHRGERFELSMSQLQALAVGLPWERLDEYAKISIL